MKRRVLFLLPALLALSPCHGETEVETANREKILLVGNAADPKSLDPHLGTGVIENNVIRALLEGLVADDAKSDTACPPGAASSWEHNADFTQWTFRLRPDGKWSDGTPLTAGDFLFAYERILRREMAAPWAEMLFYIKNAEKFNKGEIGDFKEVGVAAPDDLTLKVTLGEAVPFLPVLTRHQAWYPLPRHAVLKHGRMTDRHDNPWSAAGNFVGNGPFILKQQKPKDRVEVVKNPLYRDAAGVRLNGISFVSAENYESEIRGFLTNRLHVNYQVPTPLLDKIKATRPQDLRQDPYFASDFIRVNLSRKPLDNPKVRLALALAIDRQRLCERVMKGNSSAGTITPKLGDYQPDPIVTSDPERARALLAEAGFKDGQGFPRFRLMTSWTANPAAGEAIQEMWRNTLGINVDLQPAVWTDYVDAQRKQNYDFAFAAWTGDYPDPSTFLQMWTKGGPNNFTGWSNSDYEKMLSEAKGQANPAQRLATFKKAERLLMEELPVLPICHRGHNYLIRPEVKGWSPLLLGNHPWQQVWLEP